MGNVFINRAEREEPGSVCVLMCIAFPGRGTKREICVCDLLSDFLVHRVYPVETHMHVCARARCLVTLATTSCGTSVSPAAKCRTAQLQVVLMVS